MIIDVKEKRDCCGCCACVDSCPGRAIALKTDREGFWYPVVDEALCKACGLCGQTCPMCHRAEIKKNEFDQPRCLVAVHKNLEVRFDSSSGGLFSALASLIYRRGGYVGGAVFNDDFSVSHFISNDKKDLKRLRGAKHLQSRADGFYVAVRDLVNRGEWVLVCGAPCQMAALRLFLGKAYERLLILDFDCGGMCSPKVFRKYLEHLEGQFHAKAVYFKAMNKELGWRKLTSKVVFDDGQTLYDTKDTSLFTQGYSHTRAFFRPSCYACAFKGFPRVADITLADFHGSKKAAGSELDHDLGTSLVLLNNQKAVGIFGQLENAVLAEEAPLERALSGNPALLKPPEAPTVDREAFYASLDASSFAAVAQQFFGPSGLRGGRARRIRVWWRRVRHNAVAVRRLAGFRLRPLLQTLRYNSISALIKGRGLLIPRRSCVLHIQKKARLQLDANLLLGVSHMAGSSLETRLFVENGASLTVKAETVVGYGSDIEVFKGASLVFNGCASNIGLTLICGESIAFGRDVRIGRNVTIRDTNGGHYLSISGYRNTKPVEVGEHAWLCEGCTIMPGVKVGVGAIVGAKAVVFKNVPAHSLVLGNPAEVVLQDVYWKY